MKESLEYSVVIPLYNESQNLSILYKRVKKTITLFSDNYEIIFVDDGSKDNSYNILKEIAFLDKCVRVLSFESNYGQHPAVAAGFEESRGRFIITLDSDLQNPPEEIPKIIKKVQEGYDMVAGRRAGRKDPLSRRIVSLIINNLFSLLSGVYLRDYGSNLKVYKHHIVKEVARAYQEVPLYIPFIVLKLTKNVTEVEVKHDERIAGKSRYGFTELIGMVLSIIPRFNYKFYRFLEKLHLIKDNKPVYKIRKKIIDKKEISLI